MAKTINSDLIRGNINTIILKALYDGDRYGYDIIKEIEIKSHGQYILKQPTLYSCLKRLENQGFIEAYWGEQTSNGGRRKYYRLTDSGKEIFKQSQDEYEYSRTIIDNLISDNQYDLSTLTPLSPSIETSTTDKTEETVESIEDTEKNEDAKTVVNVESSILETSSQLTTDEPTINQEKIDYTTPAPTFYEENKEETKEDTTLNLDRVEPVKEEIPEINNTDYINSLLNENSGSYFSRNEESEHSMPQINQNTNDFDDIQKRLDALKESYNQEILELNKDTSNITQPIPQENLEYNNYDNGFYKYNTAHKGITSNEEVKTTKRSLSSLIQKSPLAENISQNKTISIKEQIKIRNFGKLSQSIAELGENAKLRPHCDTKHEYKKQYYFRDSYLRLYHYAILFVILLAEIFGTFVAGKLLLNANTKYDTPFYIASIVCAFLLPLTASALFLASPNSKKRNDYNIKSSMIFRLIIMVQLIIIIYAVNVWMGMDIMLDKNFFITLSLPTIFAINFPFSAIVFNSLRKKTKFALKE